MGVGGMFGLEDAGAYPGEKQDIREILGGEDLRFCMSGRCAIYYCLRDFMQGDTKRVAYLPAYTCETVIAPYKKAGYALRFYDVSPDRLTPIFDRDLIPHISVLGLCGYYGFSFYDPEFVRECADAGVGIIQDLTHSIFSADGIDERADYTAGSLRKWMGIPSGGVAVKRHGHFSQSLLPPEGEHVRGRLECFEEQGRVLAHSPGATEERVSEIFWATEMRLRQIFDAFESDELSERIMTQYPYRELIERRRGNYAAVLSRDPFSDAVYPVFSELGEGVCPSHLALYSPDREKVREVLAGEGVKTTVYWPFHGEVNLADYPGADYIYSRIFSVSLDQRYSAEEMTQVCEALKKIAR
ncbi:hypothetical protein TREPR_0710 [Treponema primitia ZAS-2]|uniref:DegT/DnrJ/EryC1/StrS aminotransferase n=1 Tax=Treponema primitia (strain ATCC BAA-887 / DSM 12427 / ZAS-2) TaxID=545694 RepID=F5YJY0_TREPZ|nr:hypothetical protein [Treponema primitia]AEF84041.1 hypothetical protein TREPR_0710 [Treponema primitia ZAS-2]